MGIFVGRNVAQGDNILLVRTDDDDEDDDEDDEEEDDEDEDEDERTWFQELLIPILDKYKTIPYRGHQRFLSWLGYVWPIQVDEFHPTYKDFTYPLLSRAHYATPLGLNGANEGLYYFYYDDYDDDDHLEHYDYSIPRRRRRRIPLNIFSPGLASLVNSHPDWVNVGMGHQPEFESITWNALTRDNDDEDDDDEDDDEEEEEDEDDPLFTSFSKMAPGSGFVAYDDLTAGSELFLFYGNIWHTRYRMKSQ